MGLSRDKEGFYTAYTGCRDINTRLENPMENIENEIGRLSFNWIYIRI